MKAKEKVMITDITCAIEETVSPAADQPQKIIKAIEKSAKKLAHKLTKTIKKETESLKRARHKNPVRADNNEQQRVASVPSCVLEHTPAYDEHYNMDEVG